jgi:hypothetical protein
LISTVTAVTTTTTTTTAAAVSSTVTTAATAASLAAGFGLIATITLIVLLIAKELAGAASEEIQGGEASWPSALDGALNTAVIPLLMAFAVIVCVKVMSVL